MDRHSTERPQWEHQVLVRGYKREEDQAQGQSSVVQTSKATLKPRVFLALGLVLESHICRRHRSNPRLRLWFVPEARNRSRPGRVSHRTDSLHTLTIF